VRRLIEHETAAPGFGSAMVIERLFHIAFIQLSWRMRMALRALRSGDKSISAIAALCLLDLPYGEAGRLEPR
jgi:hypothetical protein